MRSAKFQNNKVVVAVTVASLLLSFASVSFADTASTTSLSTPGSIGGNYSINTTTLAQSASSIPNYGGLFTPGIGNSVSVPGLPGIDVATTAQKLMNTMLDAYNGAQKILTENAITKAMGLSGQNKVDAENNGATNMIARVNKAVEDESNMDAVKNSMVSLDACRDVALSMSSKFGSGCDTINTIRDSYLGRTASSTSSALMTIAKGLNSNFSTSEATDLARVQRIVKKYNADSALANPKGVYDVSRFANPDVTTYDADQIADLPDFLYIQVKPHQVAKSTEQVIDQTSLASAASATNETSITLKKALVADVMADSYTDKVPGDSGISPYEAMKEFSKGKNSTEYTQKIGTSQEMSPVLLNREKALMLAFKIHQQVVKYQRSLKQEQISAQELSEQIDGKSNG